MTIATRSPDFHFRSLWLAIAVALLLLLVYGSLAPAEALPPLGENDKLLHGFAYFSVMTWMAQLCPPLRTRFGIALALTGLGILIEFIQPYVNRHFDWYDALANAVGVTVALILSLTPLRTVLAHADAWMQRRMG